MKNINIIIIFLLIFFGCNKEQPVESSGNGNSHLPEDILYVGGSFSLAGDNAVNNIAFWDGTDWYSLGAGITGRNVDVECMINYKGDLYVGGFIDSAGGKDAKNIAKWDGNEWSSVGSGINGRVTSLAVYKDELYAGGLFSNAGGTNADNIAKWNGAAWSSVGEGLSDEVYTLCIYNDELYAGGWFKENILGNFNANNIAKWNGANWDTVGSGINSGNWIKTLTVFYNELYATGSFSRCGNVDVNNIAKWNNANWQSVDSIRLSKRVYVSAVYKNELHLAGLSDDFNLLPYYAIWNGTDWNFSKFSFDNWPNCLYSSSDFLYVGGLFTTVNGKTVNGIFKWDGTSIQNIGSGIQGYVSSVLLK